MANCDDTPTAGAINEFVQDMAYVQTFVETDAVTAVTPQGKTRRTLAGIDAAATSALANVGFFVAGEFGTAFTIENRNEVGFDEVTKSTWRWNGTLPRSVLAGDTPSSPDWSIIAGGGLSLAGTFAAGGTVTSNQQLFEDSDGNKWRWSGALNYTFSAGEDPNIVAGWDKFIDNSLRSELNSGAAFISGAPVGKIERNYASFSEALASENGASTKLSTSGHTTFGLGAADYVRSGTSGTASTGDEFLFYDADGVGWKLVLSEPLDLTKVGFISGLKTDYLPTLNKAFTLAKSIYSPYQVGVFNLSAPLLIPEKSVLNLNGVEIGSAAGYAPNASKSRIRHVGNNGKVLNVNIGGSFAGDEALISYDSGVSGCIEDGCDTTRGTKNLIRFQGVENNNISRTLEKISRLQGKSFSRSQTLEFFISAPSTATNQFRRVRSLPSICKITNIKVTDINGSPDFYFDVAMRQGAGFVYPFIRARSASNIEHSANLDWFYSSQDDLFSCAVINHKGTATTFKVEVTFQDATYGTDSVAFAYSNPLDFNRPHINGAATNLLANRSAEYRSYISGGALDVSTAQASRNIDDNYNYPNITVPTPAGVRDTAQTTELKFYFKFGASNAIAEGATHIQFRVFQQPRPIKCTVINGFLSQKPDWATGSPHLAVSFQPDIEVNLSGATRDVPVVIEIPLDLKAMQNAVSEFEAQDLEYYYLTFYDNKPEHEPIEWGDVWEWDCRFLRK